MIPPKEYLKKSDLTFISITLGLIIFGFMFLPRFPFAAKNEERNPENQTASLSLLPFPEVQITATAAVVYDIKNETILFAKEENRELPLASLTKIMASIVARNLIPKEAIITVDETDLTPEGDSGLLAGEQWTRDDLLLLSLVASSNDAIHALKNYIKEESREELVQAMNEKAKELTLSNTYFLNETGLDFTPSISGGYGSALDVAKTATYAFLKEYELFQETPYEKTTVQPIGKEERIFLNTNKFLSGLPSPLLSKTGFTDLAGGNLALVFEKEPGHPIVVVVLGSTQDKRFEDIETLVWATISENN